jgi:catechol 2,3-dioxygenase-like lactoylglutathione lyase family enzyme
MGSEHRPEPNRNGQDLPGTDGTAPAGVQSLGAVTLATHDMPRALGFYLALGFSLHRGGPDASFCSLRAGSVHLNLIAEGTEGRQWSWWGRLIFQVADVDAFHRHICARGLQPEFSPRDAVWRERYFHITDPDGHELSFMHPLS